MTLMRVNGHPVTDAMLLAALRDPAIADALVAHLRTPADTQIAGQCDGAHAHAPVRSGVADAQPFVAPGGSR